MKEGDEDETERNHKSKGSMGGSFKPSLWWVHLLPPGVFFSLGDKMKSLATPYQYQAEREFADYLIMRNLEFVHQPARFLLDGRHYTPDFYVPSEQMFYEVAATRQAYQQQRTKIRRFRRLYPVLRLRVVNPDGSPYNNVSQWKTTNPTKDSKYPRLPVRELKGDLLSRPHTGVFVGREDIIRLRDIASLLNIDPKRVRDLVCRGKIAGGFLRGGHLFIDKREFLVWHKEPK